MEKNENCLIQTNNLFGVDYFLQIVFATIDITALGQFRKVIFSTMNQIKAIGQTCQHIQRITVKMLDLLTISCNLG